MPVHGGGPSARASAREWVLHLLLAQTPDRALAALIPAAPEVNPQCHAQGPTGTHPPNPSDKDSLRPQRQGPCGALLTHMHQIIIVTDRAQNTGGVLDLHRGAPYLTSDRLSGIVQAGAPACSGRGPFWFGPGAP